MSVIAITIGCILLFNPQPIAMSNEQLTISQLRG